jgi:hypothetical protein
MSRRERRAIAEKAESAGPAILHHKGGELLFEVTTSRWQQLPKGSRHTEKQLGGPENVKRLIDAKCIVPVSD